jgi:lipooligosaccharide transport system permease protein
MAHPAVAVLEYHLAGYRRMWRETVFSSFAIPTLTFVGLGAAVGRIVRGGADLGGASYLHYIAPGMLAFTAVQVAIMESGYQVQSYMNWDRIYHGMAAAPPRVADLIAGQLSYICLRVLSSGAALLAVAAAFGAVSSPRALLALPVAVLVGLAVATPMFAYAASTSGPYLMTVLRFCTLPMVFFSGVLFPIDRLPGAMQAVAYPLPLWHAVELSRSAFGGVAGSSWPAAGHVGVLGAWAVAGYVLARQRFVRGLFY